MRYRTVKFEDSLTHSEIIKFSRLHFSHLLKYKNLTKILNSVSNLIENSKEENHWGIVVA